MQISVEFKKASLVWGYFGGEKETGDDVQAEEKSSHFCGAEFITSIQRCFHSSILGFSLTIILAIRVDVRVFLLSYKH